MNLKTLVLTVFGAGVLGSLILLWLAPTHEAQAPDVAFTTVQGDTLTLSALRGRPLLVTFWSTTCPSCIDEIPRLATLHRTHAPRGFSVIGVSMAYDPPNRVIGMGRSYRIPYPLALDTGGGIAQAFGGVSLTPTFFLIAPDGRIVYQAVGPLDLDKVETLLSDMTTDG